MSTEKVMKNEVSGFRKGLRTFFSALACKAANNFHRDQRSLRSAKRELVMCWAVEVLEATSPEDSVELASIIELSSKLRIAEACIRELEPNIEFDELYKDVYRVEEKAKEAES